MDKTGFAYAAVTLGILIIISFSVPEVSASRTDLTQLSIEELMNIEVYSASKFPQKTSEAPSSVTVITSDEIKKYGYRTLADILRSLRGFYITYDRNYHYVGVRGFNRPGDYNTRVLLLVDGHRINENIYDQAFIGTDFPIDIDLIDRVEVIRGPGSSLYGSNAFFAVVNIITRKGKNFNGGEVSGEAGSYETYKTRLSYGNSFASGIETMLSGSYFDGKGDRRLFFKEFDSPATNNGIAENLDYNRSSNFFGEISFRDFTLQSAYSDWKKGVPTASFGTIFNDIRFFTRERHFFLDLKYEHTFEDGMGLMSRINYNHHKYNGDYPFDMTAPGGPSLTVVNKDYGTGEWWGGEVQITKKLFESHKIIAGAEYRDNFRQEQGNYDVEVYLDDHRKSRVWAIYAQDEFSILKNVLLNAGVRYDDYSTFGPTTNPRVALIYSPWKTTALKFLYGTAFRAPSAYELFFHAGLTKANPDLKPETIRTYELVCEQYIGNNLYATVSAFNNKIKHLINVVTDPANNISVYKNIGDVEAKGLEFELEGKWWSGLSGRMSYTFQETNDKETGKFLTNSPKHLAKINLIIPLLQEKIFMGVEEQYMSKRKTLAGSDAKSYYVTNLTVFSQNLMKNFEASASLYNLFDYEYGDPGSEEHAQDIIAQDGRGFRVKLTYRF